MPFTVMQWNWKYIFNKMHKFKQRLSTLDLVTLPNKPAGSSLLKLSLQKVHFKNWLQLWEIYILLWQELHTNDLKYNKNFNSCIKVHLGQSIFSSSEFYLEWSELNALGLDALKHAVLINWVHMCCCAMHLELNYLMSAQFQLW